MLSRTNKLTVALIFGLLGAGLTLAGEPQTDPKPPELNLGGSNDEQIAKLINELGNDLYAEREQAETSLRQAGVRAKAALERAVHQMQDPEIKVRAARLLKELQMDAADTTLDLGGGVKLRLMLIPAGKFMMGSPENEAPRGNDETQHEVTITKPFYMGKFTVTQEQYEALMGNNPSQYKGAKNPVDMLSWDDAQAFCQNLSRKSGKTVRLPTEAEWEYACRAGTSTRYYFGDDRKDLDRFAWYNANGGGTSHPVGQKEPNKFGLYDMHGNVWQWCRDWYGADYYQVQPAVDPAGPESGRWHAIRGGSWLNNSFCCRSASRWSSDFGGISRDVGFRIVLEAPAP